MQSIAKGNNTEHYSTIQKFKTQMKLESLYENEMHQTTICVGKMYSDHSIDLSHTWERNKT
jgi:hypothetical protein